MRSLALSFLFVCLAFISYAQQDTVSVKVDTIYFNKNWKPCALGDSAVYYRPPLIKMSDNTYSVKDYFLSNRQLQMSAAYTDSNSEIKSGLCFYYYDNGKIKSAGNYHMNNKIDRWKSYYRSGYLDNEGDYNNGRRSGNWKFYYDSTYALKSSANYNKHGDLYGTVEFYYRNGMPMRNDEYNKYGIWKHGKCFTADGRDTSYFPDRTYPNVVGQNRAFNKYVWNNKVYKEYYYKKKIYGDVVMRITINDQGEIVGLEVINGISDEIDAAAKQIIFDGPDWLPELDDTGNPITSSRVITVPFRIKK